MSSPDTRPASISISASALLPARAYKGINLHAFRLLAPGGLLMTYSCYGGIGIELFQTIVAGAAIDAGVGGRILKVLVLRQIIRCCSISRKGTTSRG